MLARPLLHPPTLPGRTPRPNRVLTSLSTRPDFGSRPSQQQAVARAYAGHRAGALNEPARTTDSSRTGSATEGPRPSMVEDPEAVLSYSRSGRNLRLLVAAETRGQHLDIRV
jgi:hypothetical protein